MPSASLLARTPLRDERLLWIALGGALGLAAFPLALLEARWIVYGLGALVLGLVVVLVRDRRTLLLAFFVLSVQADVSLYLLHRSEAAWLGTSGPPGVRLPLVALTAVALLAYEALTNGRLLRAFDWGWPITRWALLSLAIAILSLVHAPETLLGAYSVLNLFELWLIFLVMLNVLRSRRDVILVVDLLLVALGVQCLLYFAQVAMGATFSLVGEVRPAGQGLPRHGGTVSLSAAGFASFVMPLMFIAAARSMAAGRQAARALCGVVAVLAMAAIILTFTRAAWVASILGAVVFAVVATRRRLVRPARLLAPAAAAALCALILLPGILTRLAADHTGDYEERVALMEMAMNVVAAHPIIGAGIGNYSAVVRDHLTRDLSDAWLSIVHNAYLLRAAETGILGLLAMLGLLAAGFRRALAAARVRDRTLAAVAAGCAAGHIALFWEMYWDIWQGFPYNALLWMTWALVLALPRVAEERP